MPIPNNKKDLIRTTSLNHFLQNRNSSTWAIRFSLNKGTISILNLSSIATKILRKTKKNRNTEN